jgi:hypothetical protein
MLARIYPSRARSTAPAQALAPIVPTSLRGRPRGRLRGTIAPRISNSPPQTPQGSLRSSALFGISVFAVLDMPLDDLLRRRFTSFRAVHMPTVGRLAEGQFELLPTGRRPHFTIRLRSADDSELDRLLAALGVAQPNPQYARGMIWREEG